MYLSGVPVRVDPWPVGHAPPREEETLRTDVDDCGLCKEVYELTAASLLECGYNNIVI